VELHQRSVATSRPRVATAPQPLGVKWQREVVLSAASWPRVVSQPTRSTIAYLSTERSTPQHPTPQRTTKKYPPLYSPLPPEIAERPLRRVSGNSCTVGRWKAVEDLPYPPTAPRCGSDVLPHPLGQRKECQGEWRGQVASYRQQAARAMLVFPFIPRGMWTPTAAGNLFPHPQRDSLQVVS
jgi:hypothetical protein